MRTVDELVLGADNVGDIDVVGGGGELLVLAAGEDLGVRGVQIGYKERE